MFAVIKTGGKQYKVQPDDVVTIERVEGVAGDTAAFESVLMLGEGDDVTVGAPVVDGASVAYEIVEQGRGEKVIIFKKRRRQKSESTRGHRQHLSTVKITDILTGGEKAKVSITKADDAEAAPKAEEPAPEPAKAAAAGDVQPLFEAPAGEPDDLKLISGVGPVLEGKLNALGITTFKQIAEFTADDIVRVDDVLNFKGRIERDNWTAQAKELAAGAE